MNFVAPKEMLDAVEKEYVDSINAHINVEGKNSEVMSQAILKVAVRHAAKIHALETGLKTLKRKLMMASETVENPALKAGYAILASYADEALEIADEIVEADQ